MSTYFYYTNVETGSRPVVRAGLVNANTNAFGTRSSRYASLAGGLVAISNGAEQQLALDSAEDGVLTPSLSPVFVIGPGWYELSVSLQLVGFNSFQYLVALDDRGPQGVSSPVRISSLSGSATNLRIYNTDPLYVGFSVEPLAGGLYLDNIFIAPEPSTASLLLVGGCGLLWWRWARRRRPS